MTWNVVDNLLTRSNRLGADPLNTNFAAGNTSTKGYAKDPATGGCVDRVRVKGSGIDHQVPLLGVVCGEDGIRVNGINLCRVVQGNGHLRQEMGRPAVCGVPEAELGTCDAKRTFRKREVLPEHVAAAVFTLVGGNQPMTPGSTHTF